MTWLRGTAVGEDGIGNMYYRARSGEGWRREQRWVMYAGEDDASSVPPEWHAWLHHIVADPPSGPVKCYEWEKDHRPNATGSLQAYRPPGSTLEGGHRAATTSDYEPWRPE